MAFFTSQRQTQFAESDAAGVIHFSRFALFVEEAEHLLLQKQGFPLQLHDPASLRWPRARFHAEYLHPLYPLELIFIDLVPERVGNSSITWKWTVWKSERKQVAARGGMKTICCHVEDGKLRSRPLPNDLRKKLRSSLHA